MGEFARESTPIHANGNGRDRMKSKRLMDVVLVLGSAPLWIPLLAVLAVLVRTKLGRPVLFRQRRPGRNGECFEIAKFRTMTDDRDEKGTLLPDADRLTTFGRWLRSTSLDELPELLNVLKGEMSLVGPRPLLIQYLDRYSPEQARRHQVPPGLTGWAQVNGRNAISWEQKFALDVWYVDHRSLALDLKILVLTLLKVIRRDGISAAGDATMPEFMGTGSARGVSQWYRAVFPRGMEDGVPRFEISDLRCATKERRGAREFYPQISQISTDGKRGVLRNLKQAGTVVLLRTICANLCNLWITHPRSAATT